MTKTQIKVAIIGQGYVGFPLALLLANSKFNVIGYDTNQELVNRINTGSSHIEGIATQELIRVLQSKRYKASSDYSDMKESSIYIVCVPTPLDQNGKPDLSFLLDAINKIGKCLQKDNLVIIESTIAPGTTRNIVLPKLVEYSGLSETQFNLSFSPERIDPLNKSWNITNTPKVVSGYTDEALNVAANFYSNFIDEIVKVKSLEIAETSKLLENTYRLINISFINEMYMFCEASGVDTQDVIKAAATKPYGFTAFSPSIGIGGHCIPVDPVYLAEKFREFNLVPNFINLALEINAKMSEFIISKAIKRVGSLKGKQVLVIGVAYKPNVSDTRETPAKKLIEGLRREGAEVFWHDNLVGNWNGEKSAPLNDSYDLAILNSFHDYLNLGALKDVPLISMSSISK